MGKPEGGDHLKDPDIEGRIILKLFLETWEGGTDLIDVPQDRVQLAGCCEYGNEASGSIRCG
jgi:hypothetical protein